MFLLETLQKILSLHLAIVSLQEDRRAFLDEYSIEDYENIDVYGRVGRIKKDQASMLLRLSTACDRMQNTMVVGIDLTYKGLRLTKDSAGHVYAKRSGLNRTPLDMDSYSLVIVAGPVIEADNIVPYPIEEGSGGN